MSFVEPLSAGVLALATLAQGVAALPDTVVAVQATSALDHWADTLADIATIIIALALILFAVAALVAAWGLRNLYRKLLPVIERLRGDVDPILQHVNTVADNVSYVSTAVRGDVEQLQRAIASANQRVNRVTAQAEARVNELNAFLQVVQEEAEELFIGAASTVRGMRVSADVLRSSGEEALVEEDGYDDEYGPDEPDEGMEIRVREI